MFLLALVVVVLVMVLLMFFGVGAVGVRVGVFFFKQKTAYEILSGLVGSEMCIRDRC